MPSVKPHPLPKATGSGHLRHFFRIGLIGRVTGDRIDGRLHLAGLLIPAAGLGLQGPEYDIIKADIDLHFSGRRFELADRKVAGQQFIEHDSQRIDVRPVINGPGSPHLFWGHVMDRPHDLAGACQRVVRRRGAEKLRQAKVGNLHSPLLVHQNVFRFDVAMHDSFIVGELECFANLRDDR